MLYGYPSAAVADNWLHDALCAAIQDIHDGVCSEGGAPGWPDLLPVGARARLERRRGLRDRLERYATVVGQLPSGERERVLRALGEQNAIPFLVSCSSDCEAIDDLAEPVRDPTKELFDFAFTLLADLGIRDAQYACIYCDSEYHVCPFCGCEYFDAPGAPREALDHYLPRRRYPFAAVNLRNLVPMGTKCNSLYKRAQDILKGQNGVRRRSFDPYGNVPRISISLDESIPFGGSDGELPDWRIQFDPESEEVDTWLNVFSIRDRYTRDVLDDRFKAWLREFSVWCRASLPGDTENEAILKAVAQYADYFDECGLDDRAFLKFAVFRMLYKYCQDGDERLLAMVRDLATASGAGENA